MPASLSQGFVQIVGSNTQDALGNKLALGMMYWLPVLSTGQPASFPANIDGSSPGTVVAKPVTFAVINGVITNPDGSAICQVPDVNLSGIKLVGYRVTLIDSDTKQQLLGPGYSCVQPVGPAPFNFDTYVPPVGSQISVTSGPPGPSNYILYTKTVPDGQTPMSLKDWLDSLRGEVSFSALSTALRDVTGVDAISITVSPNVFEYTTIIPGYALHVDGSLAALTGFTVSDYMEADNSMTSFQCNGRVGFYNVPNPNFGVVYYNSNKQVIGYDSLNADNGSIGNNDSVTNIVHHVPSLSGVLAYFRVYFQDNLQNSVPYSQFMIVKGANGVAPSMPSSYVSTAPVITGGPGDNPLVRLNDMTAAIAAAGGTGTGTTVGPSNLLNPATLIASSAILYPGGPPFMNTPIYVTPNGYTRTAPISVVGKNSVGSNVALHCNNGYGPAFLDSSGSLMPATGGLLALVQASANIPAGTSIPVPSGAVSFVCYANVSGSGTGDGGPQDISHWMICVSTTTTVSFPPTFLAYGEAPSSGASGVDNTARTAAAAAQTTANSALTAATPLTGTTLGWAGDSISYGQGSGIALAPLVASITGMTISTECSWSGRQLWNALNNTGNGGSPFPTAASIAATKVYVIWLGTNLDGSSNGNIGTASDTASVGTSGANGITFPSADSYCAQLKGVLNQLLAWNPALRIIKASPYQSANQNAQTGGTHYAAGVPASVAGLALLQAVHSADLAVAGLLYGIPVLDLYSQLGICNANMNSVTVDSVHPTASCQTSRIAPFFARHLLLHSGV